jgi:hypothetical protein
MARASVLIVAACALTAAACTAGHPSRGAAASHPAAPSAGASSPRATPGTGQPGGTAPVTGASYVAGGCSATRLLLGASPAWTRSARPPSIRYALSDAGQAAAYLFGYPLRAGSPRNPDDKILWVMRRRRDGQPLRLTGRLLKPASPRMVSSTWPADSGPGEIYPSIVNVPVPGCWRFTLKWNGHRDSVDLRYVART